MGMTWYFRLPHGAFRRDGELDEMLQQQIRGTVF